MGDGMVTVTIDAQDVGWGVKEVHLLINGEAFPGNVDSFPPYEYALKFPTGGFVLGAQAIDLAGNIGDAIPVCIGVNQAAPIPDPPEPASTGDTGEGSGESGVEPTTGASGSGDESGGDPTLPGGESSGETSAGADEDSGCGCRSGHVPGDSMLALAGLGLLGLARRRRA
jgi:MYXO-CTERM domain-containing protein